MLFPSETDTDLRDDFLAVITRMASRLYGRRPSKRRAEKIKHCVEQAMQEEEEHEGGTRVQIRIRPQ